MFHLGHNHLLMVLVKKTIIILFVNRKCLDTCCLSIVLVTLLVPHVDGIKRIMLQRWCVVLLITFCNRMQFLRLISIQKMSLFLKYILEKNGTKICLKSIDSSILCSIRIVKLQKSNNLQVLPPVEMGSLNNGWRRNNGALF